MTKIVGSMTRGQSNEICNQIDKACKEQGINTEEYVSELIRTNFFGIKTTEYLQEKIKQVPKTLIRIPSLKSDGRTGLQFLADFKKANLSVGSYAEQILKTKQFQAIVTNGVVYELGVIKGEEFSDAERTTENIRKEAIKRGGITPPSEVSPLLRLNFNDEQIEALGLSWLIPMHEPINDSGGGPRLLGLSRDDVSRRFNAYDGYATNKWIRNAGFVFLFPQVNA